MELLFSVVVLAIFVYVLFWALGKLAPAEPFNYIGTAIIVLLTLTALWKLFGKYLPF